MSQSIITLAFEQYKAQQEALAIPIALDEFVLANVPNQDPSQPIDRAESLPEAQHIVYVADTSQAGFVNPNAVVYSLIMDTAIGDFEFNWVGLRNKESRIIAAISHIPTVHKFTTIAGVQNGNSVTRSIMMSYFGAQALTNINVDASTWQIDFTARLFGIDERERLANVDHYGAATFLTDGFKVVKNGNEYTATIGTGYVGGLRCHTTNTIAISNVINNSGIYLDASFQGQLTSQWQTVYTVTCSQSVLIDYIDEKNVQHYVTKVADIDAAGNVIDTRFVGGAPEYERADNAADNNDIDRSLTGNKHVKLPQFWRGITKKINALKAENNPLPQYLHNDEHATQAQAESGTSAAHWLSPVRMKQAFTSWISSAKSGDAAKLNGSVDGVTHVANTIVKRDGDGDIHARLIRSSYQNDSGIAGGGGLVFRNSLSDNYLRICNNVANIRTWLSTYSKSESDGLWLTFASKICPVGVPLPWPTDIAPSGFAVMKGQAFNKTLYTQTAKAYPLGILDDMRGLGIVGKEDGELILAYEAGQVKQHGHAGSTASSTNQGSKNTSTTGAHSHSYGTQRNDGSKPGAGYGSGGSTINYNTNSAGNHAHSVSIGSHAHTLAIALFGAAKNTIDNRKFNWIVRLA